MRISNLAMGLTPSPTRKLFDMAAKYNDTVDFTLGDPDIKTPIEIRNAACKAIMDGKTRYSANAGLIELRRAISASVLRRNGVFYDPETEIVATIGAMEALYASLLCLLNSGDEVILLEPYWINYRHMVTMCGGVPVIVSAKENNGDFAVSADDVEAAVTDKTRVIVINSPNNPSGVVYDKEFMGRIAEISKKYNITVITDEVYRRLLYDGVEYSSILDFEGMKENTVLIYSFSKEFAMTGWRIGYAAAPKELAQSITRLQENIVACAPLMSQHALVEALNDEGFDSKEIVDEFTARRQCVIEQMEGMPLLKMNPPQGTFYAFIDITDTGLDGEAFAYKLLEEEHVAVVPGGAYGDSCKNYIRIAFTLEIPRIIEGFGRIRRFVERISKGE